ncbi:glycoside hydrolase family 3 protein [Nocardia zapadnayensis]|uniref:glycoside hydrolase family 3 N-terminal domain-containing protein n=1 Tax=Nocardia rhamnosiphila TaxID=426716 RepID=UPI0022479A6F|nr:glycoside hydrolase family 3 N-terminal domain-containing protein [Nocardia zapadnayensis]MCX0270496.1 glycoside hydrolase family 3 protein [Nocardia zapadnayensis]
MRKIPLVLLAVLAALLTGCSGSENGGSGPGTTATPGAGTSPEGATGDVAGPTTTGDCSARYLAQFSTREKLAQLLTVGVTGTDDALAVVRDHQVGGIFVGSWTDQSMLTDGGLAQVTAAAKTPLMVTTDEEGGRVSRLGNLIGTAPSARVTAQTMTPDEFYTATLDRARAMQDLGITVDFAPDIDVSSQPDDSVIGDRSFSDDPAVVTEYADAYIRAMHEVGLGTVLKHFPGHGSSTGDSHLGAVQVPPLSELSTSDLVPFRELIDTGSAVMVGHLDVPGLTTPGVPASISPEVMTLLREGSGYGAAPFDGVIFTDDLSGMAAITERLSIEQAVEAALVAGADNALWISTDAVGQVLDQLEQAVAAGRLPMERVDASVLRMADYKRVPRTC